MTTDRALSLKNPLKRWRIVNDLTVRGAAAKVPIARESWRRWENGIDIPTDRNLVKVSATVDMDPSDLLAELEAFRELMPA